VKLNQLINPASLKHDIDNGLIRVRHHPTLPLDIYNYTERAQYSKKWNKATTACRGLIVNRDTGYIVARPFPKFFNYEERPNLMSLDEPVRVMDKLDGSLGIMYQAVPYTKTIPRIATRGSFESDQAINAMSILGQKYPDFYPRPGMTLLFEIIYPDNRIVIDYGDTNDLFLLGAVDIESGMVLGPEMVPEWPGPRVEYLHPTTLSEALRMAPRPGKEGIVVRSLMDETMLKIKQEDYVQLHRIVTGLNRRAVWEMLRQGLNPYEGVPDELHKWVSDVASGLEKSFTASNQTVRLIYSERLDYLDAKFPGEKSYDSWDRKEFALEMKKRKYLPWLTKTLWLLYDGKDIRDFLWKTLKPEGEENDSVF